MDDARPPGTARRIEADLVDLAELTGAVAGPGPWLSVDQGRIDDFAEVTEDRQFIHVDPVAAVAGPFGTTVAHGYLTLSLIPHLIDDLFEVRGVTAGVNYGLDRVRFPAPVPAGSRLRGRVQLVRVASVAAGAQQLTVRVTVECEGQKRPACVADVIFRYHG